MLYFAIYIESNQNDTEYTYLNGIEFEIECDDKIATKPTKPEPSTNSVVSVDAEPMTSLVVNAMNTNDISDIKQDPSRENTCTVKTTNSKFHTDPIPSIMADAHPTEQD